jgi:choline dehydrogenase-like flavoprotein
MIEFAEQLAEGALIEADVCVVGAGAAGITLALTLSKAGSRVVLAEGGFRYADRRSQELLHGEVVDPRVHAMPEHYRRRQLGGATSIWGGQCVPLDPIDLEERDWIGSARWPIEYSILQQHYPAANLWCEAGECAYVDRLATRLGYGALVDSFEDDIVLAESLERFSRPTDFGSRYRGELQAAPGLRVVLGANAVGLDSTEDRRSIQAVKFASLGNRRFKVKARQFVLAMGGLETPRFLLVASSRGQLSLGAATAHVGRYYMTHLAGSTGRVTLQKPSRHGYQRDADGIYCRRRFTVSPAAQRASKMGNFAARLHFTDPADPGHRSGVLSLAFLARRLLSHEYSVRLDPRGPSRSLAHASNLIRDLPQTTRFCGRWAVRRWFASRKLPSVVIDPVEGAYSLDIHAEQVPNEQSRVALADTLDRFGNPVLRIDWRHTQQDIETVISGVRLIGEALQRRAVGRLDWDQDAVAADILKYGAYGGHHIGTARMSDSARTGVADRDCRVFGTENLYLAGSSVFPTSGQAPPTLTIVALALRLSAHLALRGRGLR